MAKLLIVVDMQNDFITGSLGTDEAVGILPNVIEKIKGFEGDLFFTKDTHHENYLTTSEGLNLPVEHCIKGTFGWMLAPSIEMLLGEKECVVVEKPTFGSVKMAEYIAQTYKGEELYIELVGLCTDICVVSNALLLKAYFPEARIVVDQACCAGVTPESHNTALKAMAACQIEII